MSLVLGLLLIGIKLLTLTYEISIDELLDILSSDEKKYDGKIIYDKQNSSTKYTTNEVEKKICVTFSEKTSVSSNNVENEFYAPMNYKSQSMVAEGTCDMIKIQKMHRECLCQKPRKRCVKIKTNKSNLVSTIPECVIIERCEGVCPAASSCLPRKVETVEVPVIFVKLELGNEGTPTFTSECSTVQVEKHLKCQCACAITKASCNSNQVYNPDLCRCECSDSSRVIECSMQNKFWDSATCDCICPPNIPQTCSTGAFFHKGVCKCVPVNKALLEIRPERRRPIV